jgi:hypothetical protein
LPLVHNWAAGMIVVMLTALVLSVMFPINTVVNAVCGHDGSDPTGSADPTGGADDVETATHGFLKRLPVQFPMHAHCVPAGQVTSLGCLHEHPLQ